MPTHVPLFQEVRRKISQVRRLAQVRPSSVERLALLVTGLVKAESCCLAQIAQAIERLELTEAGQVTSVGRRLRRTLNDPALVPQTCYTPVLASVIDWASTLCERREVVLIVDESSKAAQIHLLRLSVAYRGGSLPLVWVVWEQNEPLPDGQYWVHLAALVARAAALVPVGVSVVVQADRAYDTPQCIDLVAARGWHWEIRCKLRSHVRYQDRRGHEFVRRALVEQRVPRPGTRWKTRGRFFKQAGWREASLVVVWAPGQTAPLGVLTDRPPRWAVVHQYRRRFWIEAGFRSDKTKGWHWEASQVQGVAHHERLLLAMAWATLLMLCLGAQVAPTLLVAATRRRSAPSHARASLFTEGLQQARRWLDRRTTRLVAWRLPDLDADCWNAQYLGAQIHQRLFPPARRQPPAASGFILRLLAPPNGAA